MNCEKGCSGKSQIRLDLEDRTQRWADVTAEIINPYSHLCYPLLEFSGGGWGESCMTSQ
uniref:Uncharacterized protein n=1 Tax=Anguilla anguilla TaxID=7936 RepID=A0A0E9U414_ANGAN